MPLGGFEYSHRLIFPPIGFCEDDSKNSVGQRKQDDFAALGGTKIGFWGNLHLRGCTKRKASIRWELPKERRAAQHPCAERTVLRVAQAFAKSCAGFAVYSSHTRKPSNRRLVNFFFVLFLFDKEKEHRSPFPKGKFKPPSADKEKENQTFQRTFHKSPPLNKNFTNRKILFFTAKRQGPF